MEVPEPLAAWFLAIGLVSREAVRAGKGTSWVLDDEATNTFLNGVVSREWPAFSSLRLPGNQQRKRLTNEGSMHS